MEQWPTAAAPPVGQLHPPVVWSCSSHLSGTVELWDQSAFLGCVLGHLTNNPFILSRKHLTGPVYLLLQDLLSIPGLR